MRRRWRVRVDASIALLAQQRVTDKRERSLGFELDEEVKNAFAFAAANGQHAMRRMVFTGSLYS